MAVGDGTRHSRRLVGGRRSVGCGQPGVRCSAHRPHHKHIHSGGTVHFDIDDRRNHIIDLGTGNHFIDIDTRNLDFVLIPGRNHNDDGARNILGREDDPIAGGNRDRLVRERQGEL